MTPEQIIASAALTADLYMQIQQLIQHNAQLQGEIKRLQELVPEPDLKPSSPTKKSNKSRTPAALL